MAGVPRRPLAQAGGGLVKTTERKRRRASLLQLGAAHLCRDGGLARWEHQAQIALNLVTTPTRSQRGK